MKKLGRPPMEKPHRKSATVIVNEDELLALHVISKKLGYKSISGFLRSAITKGILSSCNGEYTSKKDLIHWEYMKNCWNQTAHIDDNVEFVNLVKSLKGK
jgi:hypothetical protein